VTNGIFLNFDLGSCSEASQHQGDGYGISESNHCLCSFSHLLVEMALRLLHGDFQIIQWNANTIDWLGIAIVGGLPVLGRIKEVLCDLALFMRGIT
jgi:hypothetical protein